jgi:hypothetical protein
VSRTDKAVCVITQWLQALASFLWGLLNPSQLAKSPLFAVPNWFLVANCAISDQKLFRNPKVGSGITRDLGAAKRGRALKWRDWDILG